MDRMGTGVTTAAAATDNAWALMTAMRVVMEDEPSSIPAAFAERWSNGRQGRMRALVENALKDEIAESTEQARH